MIYTSYLDPTFFQHTAPVLPTTLAQVLHLVKQQRLHCGPQSTISYHFFCQRIRNSNSCGVLTSAQAASFVVNSGYRKENALVNHYESLLLAGLDLLL